MVIYLLAIAVLACAKMQFAGRERFYQDYIQKDQIQAIKGVFLLLVFARHFSQYVQYTSVLSYPFEVLGRWLEQLIVVPFLFYSGFGIAESVKKKGYAYIRNMPVRRILNVLFQFDIVVILFWATQTLL